MRSRGSRPRRCSPWPARPAPATVYVNVFVSQRVRFSLVIVPAAGELGVPGTVYVNVPLPVFTPVMTNVPLYSGWPAPLIRTVSPSL